MRLELPESCDLADLQKILEFTDLGAADEFTLLVPENCDIHPGAMCLLVAISRRVRDGGGSVSIDGDLVSPHLAEMGFYSVFLGEEPDAPAVDPTGRFIPLTTLENSKSIEAFATDLVPLLHATPQTSKAVAYVAHELLRNVFEHSGSRSGAIVGASVAPDGRVELGVSDLGIGICASIRRVHSAATEEDAIALAFAPGVSGATAAYGGNERNGGAGLFFLKAITSTSRQRLAVVTGGVFMRLEPSESGNVEVSISNESVTWLSPTVQFQGTLVAVDLSLSDEVSFGDLFATIRTAYTVDTKQMKRARRKAQFT